MSRLGHGGDKFNKTDKFGNPIQYTGGNIGGHGHKTRINDIHTTKGNTGAHGVQTGGKHGTDTVNHGDKGHEQVGNIGDHGQETYIGADAIKGNTGVYGEHGTDAVNHGNKNHGQGENIGDHGNKTYTDSFHITEENNVIYGTQTDGNHGTGAVNNDNKGHGQGDILHRSNSLNSSSSKDDGLGGKKKKSIINEIKEKLPGENKPTADSQDAYAHGHGATTTPNEGVTTTHEGNGGHGTDEQNEKKSFMKKMKDKLTGATNTPLEGSSGGNKADVTIHEPDEAHGTGEQSEKKGFIEKIKDKLTGHH